MSTRTYSLQGPLSLIIASMIWAFSWGLIKGQLTTLDPNFVAWARILITLPIFLPIVRFRGLSTNALLYLIFMGVIQYGLMYILVIRSYQYLQAHQVVLFTTFTPIYVVLIYDIWNRVFRPFYLIAACIAFLGAAILSYHTADWKNLFRGFLLVQAADICFAFGQVAYKAFREKHTDLKDHNIFGWLFLGATLFTGVMSYLSGGLNQYKSLTTEQTWTLLYLGFVATGLAFFLWNKGAVKTHPGTLAVLNNIKIPLGVLVSCLVFGEKVTWSILLISLSLMLFAVYLCEWKHKKEACF